MPDQGTAVITGDYEIDLGRDQLFGFWSGTLYLVKGETRTALARLPLLGFAVSEEAVVQAAKVFAERHRERHTVRLDLGTR
jgi:hypothetical protein